MSTRNPQKAPGRKPGEACTEFHLHKSQFSETDKSDVFDYTDHRLTNYISSIKDESQRHTLLEILETYRKGLVAVAWKSGKPVWVKVTKEKG